MKRLSPFAAGLGLLALALSSCTSLHQKLSFAAIPADLPVSASSSLLVEGRVVQLDEIEASTPFSIRKEVKLPLQTPLAKVDIYPELKAVSAENGGDAITGLKVSILDFNPGDYNWVCIERNLGLGFAVGGASLFVEGLVYDNMQSGYGASMSGGDLTKGFMISGAAFLGVGAAFFGLSYLHESHGVSVYTIGLEGNSVRISKPLE
jgi:hypothetical protein